MPCLDTQNWSFTDLIAAFLNLFIAYLLLCTSLFIYLMLRFLGFLGLSLPMFHNGRFGDPNMRKFLQMDLVNCASERISAVDRSIKSKIPFGSISSDDDSNRFVESKLVRKNNGDISNARVKDKTEDLPSKNKELDGLNLMTVHGMKGRRYVTRRSRNDLKPYRRGRVDCGSLRSMSSSETFDESVKSPYIRAKDERFSNYDRKGFSDISDSAKTGEGMSPSHWSESFARNLDEISVKDLKEALREERSARAVVCIELEEERNAAASAADEAMAMIHRLQDEKAAIEMEANQFKRMVEEKSTFDAEEMVILKDILIRREREKHFLEKEVEVYRHLLMEFDEMEFSNLPSEQNLQESTTDKTVKPGHQEVAVLVQEVNGTVLDIPYREEQSQNRDHYKSDSEVAYSRVRDVYMVKDETENICNKKKLEETSSASGNARKLPPLCRPPRKSLSASESRRKSMSAFDYERLKIENEVELLRERLKVVQVEKEKLQRRSSLPPFPSKVRVTPEKRGWRRSSRDLHSS